MGIGASAKGRDSQRDSRFGSTGIKKASAGSMGLVES